MDSVSQGDPMKKKIADATADQAAVPPQPASKSMFSEQAKPHSLSDAAHSTRSQPNNSIFQDDATKNKSAGSAAGRTAVSAQPLDRSIFADQQALSSSGVFPGRATSQTANAGQPPRVENIFSAQATGANASQSPLPKPLSPTAVAGLTLITFNVFCLYWLWSTYKRIRLINSAATSITPGRAWGFLFIPVFGVFWFVRIAFDLPRAILRIQGSTTTGMRFGRSAATAMFLLGILWPNGLALHGRAAIAWIAGCETLLLGFIAYSQASLERAFITSTAHVATWDRRPERLLLGAVGIAACAALVCYLSLLRPTQAQLAQQAHEALAGGDFTKAASLLGKVATPEAKLQLASLYKNGLGVEQDSQSAVSLLTAAAQAGLPLAQTTLGTWYANGEGVEANSSTAVDWYQKAASQGDTNAAVLLGLAYAAGDGVDQDPAEAYMWFAVAEKHGSDYATSEKEIVGDLMTADQKKTAEDNASVECQHESGGRP